MTSFDIAGVRANENRPLPVHLERGYFCPRFSVIALFCLVFPSERRLIFL